MTAPRRVSGSHHGLMNRLLIILYLNGIKFIFVLFISRAHNWCMYGRLATDAGSSKALHKKPDFSRIRVFLHIAGLPLDYLIFVTSNNLCQLSNSTVHFFGLRHFILLHSHLQFLPVKFCMPALLYSHGQPTSSLCMFIGRFISFRLSMNDTANLVFKRRLMAAAWEPGKLSGGSVCLHPPRNTRLAMESRSTMLSKSLPNSLYKVMSWSEGKHDPRHPGDTVTECETPTN